MKAGFAERERESHCPARHQVHKALRVIVITMGISPIVGPLLESRHKVVGIIESAQRAGNKRKMESQYIELRIGYTRD